MSTKEEIFNYVMHSPENTNPAVLGSMLNSLEEGGGGIEYFDITYTCEEGGEPSIDKTHAQILSAYNSGKVVRLIIPTGSYIEGESSTSYNTLKMNLCGLSMYDNDESYAEFSFYCISNGFVGDNVYTVDATIDDTGLAFIKTYQIG